jgi:hypothetical protein
MPRLSILMCLLMNRVKASRINVDGVCSVGFRLTVGSFGRDLSQAYRVAITSTVNPLRYPVSGKVTSTG